MRAPSGTGDGDGYLSLLRAYPGFRRLFAARSISLLGDWFSLIAVIAMLREVTGSDPRALSGLLILKLLPMFLVGPLAGVIADRFHRRTVMMASDLVRVLLVIALLATPAVPHPVQYAFVLILLQVGASAFFEPARSASLPELVPDRMLSSANALGAIAWSTMFALGAAFGGFVTAWLGWRAALGIDAATYLISAVLVGGIALPRRVREPGRRLDWKTLTGWPDFRDGLRLVFRHPQLATGIFIKTGWGVAGAVTLLLTLFGERVYTMNGRPDLGVGLLYLARAVGTGIGPVLARRFLPDESPATLRRLIAGSFLWAAFWYLAFSRVDDPIAAVICVTAAHFGGSVIWVYSTVALQRMVPNEFLGRVTSTDLGLATLSISVATWAYGMFAAAPGADLRQLVRWLAVSLLVPTAIWLAASARWPVGARIRAEVG